MIIGISHIVLTSTDIKRDRDWLEYAGWLTKFTHTGIPTHPGKLPYMSTRSTEQSLVLMKPPTGLAVELIHYSNSLNDTTPSPLQILLPQPANSSVIDGLTCDLLFQNPAPSPSMIIHYVTDPAKAKRFWCTGLGFKSSASTEEGNIELHITSPVPSLQASLSLVHCVRPKETPCLLDAPGFRCISFLCTDLERDGEQLRLAGATGSTGVMHLSLNGNELDLELFAGPDGVMVELCAITVKKN
jgi:hypothetical protein